MKHALHTLRQQAIAGSLFPAASLLEAMNQLGFVQADPIRAPARAQDLILRHRVQDYRVGDLERDYPALDLEEDFLYAYGFMPKSTWQLVHPRPEIELSMADKRVLDFVSNNPHSHPRQVEAYLGRTRERNDWGGFSAGTTRSLQALHYRGFLRVARRENGVKLYELASQKYPSIESAERLRQLVLLITNILNPITDRNLRAALWHLAHAAPALNVQKSIIKQLVNTGDLTQEVVDGIRYIWPTLTSANNPMNETVRFLAPFDPLVWDRQRFEHLWGWAYRFEAYTPPAKRELGYYALPILWRDDMVGWVTVSQSEGNLVVEPGLKKDVSLDDDFFTEFDIEVERLRLFLQKRD
ncbi:DNA glycosylase AlkZ-like family protein [Spirosoma foliorum]|uniref:YcaQ family DNA glycosylase n=1 Tax=Spirosoma foliorum TaxID=2710596 RepID=A0A7G5H3K6_9BACT|nr:crosslink repair DNA glycosylase YcaQ family protein [Spirosoma foliorum]QMW05698.1 YcaQ family DNA glycosylase [Spirosoma foliorum]